MKQIEKKPNKGFTLVELIVVIAIIGVLAAVLAPQYLKYVETARQQKVLQEAETIDSAFRMALTEYLIDDGEA